MSQEPEKYMNKTVAEIAIEMGYNPALVQKHEIELEKYIAKKFHEKYPNEEVITVNYHSSDNHPEKEEKKGKENNK